MSSFGRIFRVTTFGESHSNGIGCIIEGVPPRLLLTHEKIQKQVDRRRPGQSSVTTQRDESDKVEILSGVEKDLTLGTPLCLFIKNQDVRKKDYDPFSHIPRPGHADYTYLIKYGIKAESGGGRSSARETAARVMAGAVADIILEKFLNLKVVAYVSSIGMISIPEEITKAYIKNPPTREEIDKNGSYDVYIRKSLPANEIKEDCLLSKHECIYIDHEGFIYNSLGQIIEGIKLNSSEEYLKTFFDFKEKIVTRCPHKESALKMILLILKIKSEKDSIGGTINCICKNVPVGLGEPCFDKLEAILAHAMLSIPATKGFEIGSGFEGTKLKGSEHNDLFIAERGSEIEIDEEINFPKKLKTKSNNAGGILGGISSGENIYFRVAFKPVSTIGLPQETSDYNGEITKLEAKGRHDPCVLPRAPAIIEAMASITLVDAFLLQGSQPKSQILKDY